MSLVIRKLWRKQEGTFFCISTKVPNKDGTWKDHFFRKDQFDDIPQFLKEHAHLELYFSPHGYSRRSRTVDEAVAPQLMWADLDEVNPELIPDKYKPTIAVQTSEGRFMGLWVLTDKATTLELNRRLNMEICPESHSSWIFTKALRMPGTMNRKYLKPQKVILLWDDGPKYTFVQMDRNLPKLDQPSVSGSNAREIFKKYRKHIDVDVQREIFKGNPKKGVRSEVMWKIIKSFIEAGADEDEVYEVIKVSPWNKFKGLRTEERSIRKQIAKAFDEKLTGYGQEKPKHKQSQKEELSESDSYDADTDKKKLNLLRMDEVQEEEVEWLWPGRLPMGELVILEGDPGVGKSFLAQWLAVRVADGHKLPQEYPTSFKPIMGKTLYFDLENDAARVTKKRLVASGLKNLGNFIQVASPLTMEDEDDMELIYEAMNEIKPVLAIFDTINNYIGRADIHNSKEATQAFTPFSQLARKFNCTVIVLRHLTKTSQGTSALYRGQGSIAQTGVARVVLTVGQIGEHSDFEEEEKWVGCAVTKNNLAHKGQTLVYKIEYDAKAKGGYDDKAHILIHPDRFTNLDADALLASRDGKEKGKKSDKMTDTEGKDQAKAFLLELLKDGNIVAFEKLLKSANSSGITHKDLNAAAKEMGVKKNKGDWFLDLK